MTEPRKPPFGLGLRSIGHLALVDATEPEDARAVVQSARDCVIFVRSTIQTLPMKVLYEDA
jgi:hypothetical protein